MKRLSAALSAALLCTGSALRADDAPKTDAPPRDAQPQPAELFKQLDKDANGQLAKDEVPESQVRFFERLVRVGDKDENGELTKDEFVAAMEAPEIKSQARPAEGRPGEGRPGGRMQFNPEDMFTQMDRNGDGKISRSEVPERAADRLNPIFDRLGKDELTKDEFRRAAERFAGGAPAGGTPGAGRPGMAGRFGEEALARMRSFDTNKDGKVTLDEAPEGEARERVQQIMDRTGRDAVDLEQFARMISDREGPPPGERPRPEGAEGDRPRPEGAQGDRPRPEGVGDRPRPEGGQADRPRPEGGEGDRPRPEGVPGDRPRPEGQPPFRDGEGRPPMFVPPVFGVLDENRDGRLSTEEAANLAKKFAELDRNHDGQLDRAELLGFPPGAGMMRDGEGGRPPFGPRDGEGQPREGYRPPREDGDRPRPEGDRPEGTRPEGDRPRPEGDQPREGDRPRPERDDA